MLVLWQDSTDLQETRVCQPVIKAAIDHQVTVVRLIVHKCTEEEK